MSGFFYDPFVRWQQKPEKMIPVAKKTVSWHRLERSSEAVEVTAAAESLKRPNQSIIDHKCNLIS